MASVAQILANRSNAQKSTGPRTAEGKAAVAQNAVRHGLLAQRAVIKGEDRGEFALYRDRMLEDLDPVGSMETMLAERVVNLAWRLRRAERLESAALAALEASQVVDVPAQPAPVPAEGAAQEQGTPDGDEEAVIARVVVQDFGGAKLLDQLLGYERRIENSLYRTMGELRKQRLLREVEEGVSSLKCEVSSEQSQLSSPPSFPTSDFALQSPDVTTNGAESDDPLCQTKPKEVSSLTCQVSSGQSQEASPLSLPTSNFTLQAADEVCETKPEEVSSGKCEVSSEQGHESSPPGLPTSNFTLQTADEVRETKPIGDGQG